MVTVTTHPPTNALRLSAGDYSTLRCCGLLSRFPTSRGTHGGRRKRVADSSLCHLSKLGLVNARSLMKNREVIIDHVSSYGLDLLAVTESWLTTDHGDMDLSYPSVLKDLMVYILRGLENRGVALRLSTKTLSNHSGSMSYLISIPSNAWIRVFRFSRTSRG